jgi:monofunctional biosynthetic peptidoglycan transglycosylase
MLGPMPVAAADASPPARPRRRWRALLARVIEVGTIAAAIGALLLWCSIPSTARLRAENPTSTAFIELRREEAAARGRELRVKWDWRPLGKISRYLRAAVIHAEDANFYRHDGVDWSALEQAVESNWERGSMAVGGSTITQQLAKNIYLSPRRSMIRKARELLIAFALEDHLPKQRILELYLNVVEWGDGVFGAEAAARHWFGRSAQALTPSQAARLAIALPNPFDRAPSVQSAMLTRKAVRIIRLFRMQGLIDAAQERAALDEVGAPGEKVLPSRRPGEDDPGTPEPPPPEPESGAREPEWPGSPRSQGPAAPGSPASGAPVPPAPSSPAAPGPASDTPAVPAPPAQAPPAPAPAPAPTPE